MSQTPSESAPEPEAAASAPDTPEAAQHAAEAPVEANRAEPELVTETVRDEVVVRKAPRVGVFLVLGVAVGVLAALVLTFAFPENAEFDRGQVFGFLLLGCGAVGAALGGLVAVVLDRTSTKRARTVIAEHDETHR
ncbi:hypothetical protein [Agromyces archimandritae]|uniref:Potassium transporter Trk n=1 Tax=Agromyces archimandritae TaxID=2781962 RepID=A0A975FPA3_9MICO|nr:hypothetical protein [Agromyces archimandritae]QTX05799.1 hypothetical protein G127AT_06245 [Agromyces archimandritae]